MALFLSTYINRVDKKGRVSFPASFRAALMGQPVTDQAFQGVVLFRSNTHDALEGFSMSRMEELSQRIDNFDMFSPEQDDMATAIFAESVALSIDGDGRIILPQDLLDFAGITEQAAFVGLGPKFQIWEPSRLEARKKQARDSVAKQKMTLPNPRSKGGE